MVQAVEIEVDTEHNSNLFFRPLQRNVRGRFDWSRLHEPMARVKAHEWPTPLPGQRLGVDAKGVGYIAEPLHDEQHAPTKERIEGKLHRKLEPAKQTFDNVHLPSWYYWMQRAVEAGIAQVVSGKLPDDIGGKPKKDFIFAEPERSDTDKLTAAIEQQTEAFRELTAAIGSLLKAKK
jgi:hypothetical protein